MPALNSSQKRSHDTAFTETSSSNTRPKAAPAVPSFSAGITELLASSNLPGRSSSQRDPKIPKSNVLGLTPSLDERDASSDDEGEEVRLAGGSNVSGYQFEYRGQTSTLKTAADIATWIAERKKRFPTAARVETAKREAAERRKKFEDERRARIDAARKQREDSGHRHRAGRRKSEVNPHSVEEKHGQASNIDSKSEFEARAEKLRRKAEKAAKQLARAQKSLKKIQSEQAAPSAFQTADLTSTPPQISGDLHVFTGKNTQLEQDDHLHTTAEVADSIRGANHDLAAQESPSLNRIIEDGESDVGSQEGISSESESSLSDSESTSSSGSDFSEAESDDSIPEEHTSLQTNPTRILPPKRTASHQPRTPPVCRTFLRTGKCKFGKHCRYSHERPRHGQRKGLWEVMVEREQEQERERMLQAIVTLGNNGMLDDNPQDRFQGAVS